MKHKKGNPWILSQPQVHPSEEFENNCASLIEWYCKSALHVSKLRTVVYLQLFWKLPASRCPTTASSSSTTTGTASSSVTSLEGNSESCPPKANESWPGPKTLVRPISRLYLKYIRQSHFFFIVRLIKWIMQFLSSVSVSSPPKANASCPGPRTLRPFLSFLFHINLLYFIFRCLH